MWISVLTRFIFGHTTLIKYEPGNYCKHLNLNKMKLQKMTRHSINFYSPRKKDDCIFQAPVIHLSKVQYLKHQMMDIADFISVRIYIAYFVRLSARCTDSLH